MYFGHTMDSLLFCKRMLCLSPLEGQSFFFFLFIKEARDGLWLSLPFFHYFSRYLYVRNEGPMKHKMIDLSFLS